MNERGSSRDWGQFRSSRRKRCAVIRVCDGKRLLNATASDARLQVAVVHKLRIGRIFEEHDQVVQQKKSRKKTTVVESNNQRVSRV